MPNPEENFYRVCHIVLDVIPKGLHSLFKCLWDGKYPYTPWDDRPASGQNFLKKERNQTVRTTVNRYMNHGDSNQFDGTCLFSILLYSSQNFLQGQPVVKTVIDQLRIIRNGFFAHLPGASMAHNDYRTLLADVKAIFTQLGWPITPICDTEHKYLNTSQLKQLEDALIAEGRLNRNLEDRLQYVETKTDTTAQTLDSVAAEVASTKSVIKANTQSIDLLQSDMVSTLARLDLLDQERIKGALKIESKLRVKI